MAAENTRNFDMIFTFHKITPLTGPPHAILRPNLEEKYPCYGSS